MKTLIQIIMFLLLPLTLIAQKSLPEGVAMNFETMYPGSVMIKSDQDSLKQVSLWFKWEGKKYLARYTHEGFWQFTGIECNVADIPSGLKQMVLDKFSGIKNIQFYRAESPFETNRFLVNAGLYKRFLATAEGIILSY